MTSCDDQGGQTARDANGRWLKGHCPNPRGRPKKRRDPAYDPSNIWYFGNTLIDVRTNGQVDTMDRRAALLLKMYEDAMKGKVSMQRFFYQEFEKNDSRMAAMRNRYQQLATEWFVDNPDYREIPYSVELEMMGLESLLRHYFPSLFERSGDDEN